MSEQNWQEEVAQWATYIGLTLKAGRVPTIEVEREDWINEELAPEFRGSVCLDGWVYIHRAPVNVKGGLTGPRTEIGYCISEARGVPGDFWTPDDVDIISREEFDTISAAQAAVSAWRLWSDNLIDGAIASEIEARFFDENYPEEEV